WEKHMIEDEEKHWPSASTAIEKYTMVKWTDNINREPYTSRGVRTVRRRVLGNTTIVIWQGAGYLAYLVTSLIQPNGIRIPTNNMGKNQSTEARKEIDKLYGLRKV